MKRILIIDDQREVREMVDYMLAQANFEVVGARSGEEGLLQARLFRPDLVLCDIMMPGMNGYEVLASFRKTAELSTIPFVFLTAKAEPTELRKGMSQGADDYVTKPFSADELVAAVSARLQKQESLVGKFEKKLEMLRQGLSTVLPHELRTPLTLVLAHSSLLMELYDGLKREEIDESLRSIHAAGLRLHRLIENLLLYAEPNGDMSLRIERLEPVDAARVVGMVADRLGRSYNRSEDISVENGNGMLDIHEFHLEKIVQELLDNALKFSEPGSRIRVTTDLKDKLWLLSVQDRGRGMHKEEIEQVEAYIQFGRQRFEQQGGGLGLAVSRHLVRLYKGTLQIHSHPGEGTRVEVTLPVGLTSA